MLLEKGSNRDYSRISAGSVAARFFITPPLLLSTLERYLSRMLKKAVQQGRSERRGEAYAAVR
jgi:hypothetical protein